MMIMDRAAEPPGDETPRTMRRAALGVLAMCFVFAATGRGLGESFTVFLLPIAQSFGWDRADIVSLYSLSALWSGLAAPLVGRLFDGYGPRAVYTLGLGLLGTAFALASQADALWQLQLLVGFAAGFAIACIGNVPNSMLLGRWFGPRLPTAMAIVYSANGAGVLALLPLSQLLIDTVGWRGAYQAIGVALLVAVLPLLMFGRGIASANASARRHASSLEDAGWTLRRAARHHAFWALFATFFFTAIGMFAISPQVVAYLVDAGFAPLEAASAWGFSGIALVVGMLSISWLDSVIGRRRSLLVSYGFSLAGIAMLWALKSYPNIVLLTGFVICFGSMVGSRGPLITATAMKIFAGERVGLIYGTIAIGSGLGAAFGAWFGGVLHDWSGSYDPLLAFAFVSVVIGALPFFTVKALQ